MLSKEQINAFWDNIFHREDDPSKRDILNILAHIPLFSKLSRGELKKVAKIIHERHYAAGESLFRMGEPGAAMFIVKAGQVDIVMPKEDSNGLILASLGPGSFLGELALLDDSPRSASAVAPKDTVAMAFFRADLNKLIETEAHIGSKILKELALIIGQRLKLTNEQLYSTPKPAASGS
ncbi:MAG: cyclic nucleotide-binding domain-containing protein [bacterium]|nr:cyclic nucleotide-binding domain-containing protein [bacterium]